MEEIQIKLDIIFKLLEKKKQMLSQVLNITENQKRVIDFKNGGLEDKKEFLSEAVQEKQKLIEEIVGIDTAFLSIFDSFKGKLNENRQIFKADILKMTDIIKEITDIDVKIRVTEKINSRFNTAPEYVTQPKINALKADKAYIINQYKKNTARK